MNSIVLEQVTKRFGSHVAVNDLSLEVPAGSVYGFIGPNGSGKTTTIRMILHILLPDAGRITVLGDLALDSLQVMNLLLEIEDKFDISIPVNILPDVKTVRDLALQIENLVRET